MLAETVYNVFQALPEAEKVRLYVMLEKDKKATEPIEVKDDGQLTDAECTEALMLILRKQRNEKLKNKNLKVVK